MLDTLRKPFFVAAVVLMAIAVLIELGSAAVLRKAGETAAGLDVPAPGQGIPAVGLLDVLLLYTVLVMGAALIVPERIQGRVQGLATLIFSIMLLVADILLLVTTFGVLVLMVSLFLAPLFGTIAYLALWGSFDT